MSGELLIVIVPFIIVSLFIVVGGFFIIRSVYARKAKATAKTETIGKQIDSLRQQIVVVTSTTIPGKEIKDVIGSVTGVSKVEASTDAEFRLAEKEALLDIMNQAIALGANSIVDLKMTTGSYEQLGSQQMVSKVIYTGTAVKV